MDTFWPGVGANWGRWGERDERGTLNLVGPEKIRSAAASVRSGRAISLARTLDDRLPAYYPAAGESAFEHRMITWWGSNAGGDVQAASDRVSSECHGLEITHMDALSHIGHRGRGYGGRDFASMAGPDGVAECDITAAAPVVTRAVLADIPRLRGVDHLPAGTAVGHDELAEAAPGLGAGDALVVRTGRWNAPSPAPDPGDRYGHLSGLHPDALRFVADRDAAVVGTDGPGDAFPVAVEHCRLPVHVLALVYLGVHLVHSMVLDELAAALAAEDRTDFMLVLGPLVVPGATGTPITPVAVL
jgi:kynurenine formamidase